MVSLQLVATSAIPLSIATVVSPGYAIPDLLQCVYLLSSVS